MKRTLRRPPFLVATALIMVMALAAACGSDRRTGSEELLKFEEEKQQKRLGEREQTTEEKAGGGESPLALAASPKASPPAEEQFFDVTLVANSPYFEPGNDLQMPVGFTLRVTNKDGTAARPTRSFSAEDGPFDSGPLKPGQSWTMKFSRGGQWRIVDRSAPFIFASLRVG